LLYHSSKRLYRLEKLHIIILYEQLNVYLFHLENNKERKLKIIIVVQ